MNKTVFTSDLKTIVIDVPYGKSTEETYTSYYPGKILEASSKSSNPLGKKLSAMNLSITFKDGNTYPVESIFQSSKVFENGLQCRDLLTSNPYAAKKDPRLRQNGRVVGFNLYNVNYSNKPTTAFYNWIYINALNLKTPLAREVITYDAFTDMFYSPTKTINCQAKALALYVYLIKNKLITIGNRIPFSFIQSQPEL